MFRRRGQPASTSSVRPLPLQRPLTDAAALRGGGSTKRDNDVKESLDEHRTGERWNPAPQGRSPSAASKPRGDRVLARHDIQDPARPSGIRLPAGEGPTVRIPTPAISTERERS